MKKLLLKGVSVVMIGGVIIGYSSVNTKAKEQKLYDRDIDIVEEYRAVNKYKKSNIATIYNDFIKEQDEKQKKEKEKLEESIQFMESLRAINKYKKVD